MYSIRVSAQSCACGLLVLCVGVAIRIHRRAKFSRLAHTGLIFQRVAFKMPTITLQERCLPSPFKKEGKRIGHSLDSRIDFGGGSVRAAVRVDGSWRSRYRPRTRDALQPSIGEQPDHLATRTASAGPIRFRQ